MSLILNELHQHRMHMAHIERQGMIVVKCTVHNIEKGAIVKEDGSLSV